MLEKKPLDCNNSTVSSDVNGSDELCHEKHNGSNTSINSTEKDISEFLIKTEEDSKSTTMNLCDGHLSINDNICSITNSLNSSTMDIKTSTVSNMCSNSCATSCVSSQDVSAVVSNGNSGTCGSEINCSSTTVSTATPVNPSRDGIQDGMLHYAFALCFLVIF